MKKLIFMLSALLLLGSCMSNLVEEPKPKPKNCYIYHLDGTVSILPCPPVVTLSN